ncbi:hypothetical protein BCR39DRAFT_317561 [Naematelia encephala]|uniref:Cytoplasmic tRNA 2-thiolation protein 2 n=1 Tax=Naematelia encephala TaxID=71784 RepID=A0A1Y2AR35_9TREE|nr:hypothetical protein BCR39DRAFT_317561 [Naematelia encephala]
MSCGNEPDVAPDGGQSGGEALMPRRRQVRRVDRAICQKCKTAKSKYIMHSATFCPACFESTLNVRFLRTLFPALRPPHSKVKDLSRPPLQKGNALIGLSGGAGSVAMLDLLMRFGLIGRGTGARADLTKGEKEVVWDWATVVHVRFEEDVEKETELQRVVEGWGLQWMLLKAEDVFDSGLRQRLGGTQDDGPELGVDLHYHDLPLTELSSSSSLTPREKLLSLLTALPPASRPAMLQSILDHLLTFTAATLPNISHLLLGETATRQAQRVISGTALGRGWALPLDLAAKRSTSGDVVQLKPMRDIGSKETAILCRLRELASWNERRWFLGPEGKEKGKGGSGTRSIEGLTERFIAGLSVSHPSTVSTINRTGDKLVFPGETGSIASCPLCESPLEPSALDWKSRTALTSLSASTVTVPKNRKGDGKGLGLANMLCYACLTTLSRSPIAKHSPSLLGQGSVPLPLWVSAHVGRGTIEQYLIGQDEDEE